MTATVTLTETRSQAVSLLVIFCKKEPPRASLRVSSVSLTGATWRSMQLNRATAAVPIPTYFCLGDRAYSDKVTAKLGLGSAPKNLVRLGRRWSLDGSGQN